MSARSQHKTAQAAAIDLYKDVMEIDETYFLRASA